MLKKQSFLLSVTMSLLPFFSFASDDCNGNQIVRNGNNEIGLSAPSDFYFYWNQQNSGMVQEKDMCLISRWRSGNTYTRMPIQIRAFGQNTQYSNLGQFTARDRNNNFIKYKMEMFSTNTSTYVPLMQNQFVSGIQGSITCSDSLRNKMRISVDLSDLDNSLNGDYWDLVYLTAAKDNLAYTVDHFYVYIQVRGGRIQVNLLDDINLGLYKVGSGNVSQEEQFCVHSAPSTGYYITIYDRNYSSSGGNYSLTGANGGTLPYKVSFRTTSTNYINMTNGNTYGVFKGNRVQNCSNVETPNTAERAYMKIDISQSDLMKVIPQKYSGTVYLTVCPE